MKKSHLEQHPLSNKIDTMIVMNTMIIMIEQSVIVMVWYDNVMRLGKPWNDYPRK